MKMKCVICDDEKNICDAMRRYLSEFFEENRMTAEIDCFQSPEEMLGKDEVYDIAFLDVEMGETSGIDAGKRLKEKNKNTLLFIITGHEYNYLDEALEQEAFRYLTKPVDKHRLFNNLKSAVNRIINNNFRITFAAQGENVTLYTKDIVLVRTEKRKTVVQTVSREYVSEKKITYWKEQLPSSAFMETFKGVIVGFEHIVSFNADKIALDVDGLYAYVSKRNYREFKTRYTMFIEARA